MFHYPRDRHGLGQIIKQFGLLKRVGGQRVKSISSQVPVPLKCLFEYKKPSQPVKKRAVTKHKSNVPAFFTKNCNLSCGQSAE